MDKSNQKNTRKSTKKQQQQTQLAIALSKSQYEHAKQQSILYLDNIDHQYQHQHIEKPQPQFSLPLQLQQYQQKIYQTYSQDQQSPRNYQTIQPDQSFLQLFSDLNPKWLKAQQKSQQQANVRQNQKLSNKIVLKYLNNQEVFIDGFEEWMADEIKFNAEKLGCKVLQEIKNNCLAIVEKKIAEKIKKKYKHFDKIKYVNQKYLQDCIQKKCRLSPSAYYIRFTA